MKTTKLQIIILSCMMIPNFSCSENDTPEQIIPTPGEEQIIPTPGEGENYEGFPVGTWEQTSFSVTDHYNGETTTSEEEPEGTFVFMKDGTLGSVINNSVVTDGYSHFKWDATASILTIWTYDEEKPSKYEQTIGNIEITNGGNGFKMTVHDDYPQENGWTETVTTYKKRPDIKQ